MRNGKIRRFRPRPNKNGFRRQGHPNKSNGIQQINSHRSNFRSGTPKNPQNLERLVEKYKILAKEALSSGDEVLNQNYLQHSDHFSRILTSQENQRILSESAIDTNVSNQLKVENENKEVEETSKE